MTTALDPTPKPALAPAGSLTKPTVRRALARENDDVLGVGWLHGSFQVAVFRRQKMSGSWSAPASVKTLEELAVALDDALRELKFAGTEMFLLLENDQFAHHVEATPGFSDSMARGYLAARVERYEKENSRVLWVSQATAGVKKERSFFLHMLPRTFYEALNKILLERRLDLTRIVPLIVPVQRELDRFPISKGRPVLVAVEAGGATVVMVAKVGGELLFGRTILASWSADPARIGVEINRSLLYANQQFGSTVDRVWLLGQSNQATAEVNAKCGTGRQITVLPTSPVEWLQTVAKISPRHPVNLLAGHLKRKRLQQAIRRSLFVACWLGLIFLVVDSWSRRQAWNGERRQYAQLRAGEDQMAAERDRLTARNEAAEQERAFIRQAADDRLPAVPGKFTAYIAGMLPPEMRLTDLDVKWDDSTGGWSFRLEGTVDADEDTAREIVAGLQRQLAKSPLRVRSPEAARTVSALPRTAGLTTAATMQRFSLEGTMLEK